jgi:hypothetical protein
MDILGGMTNSEEKPQIYFGFKTIGQQFFANGETPIVFEELKLDINSFKSGWGTYTKAEGFKYQWDAEFGKAETRPDKEWKRAFSCWVLPKGHHPMLWQRFSYSEATAFNSILDLFWDEKSQNPGKFPVVKYTGCKPIQVGQGSSSELSFKFVSWSDKGFEIPEWYIDPDAPADDGFKSPNDGLADLVNKAEEDNDDVPF